MSFALRTGGRVLALAAVVFIAHCAPTVTNTGFSGKWQRTSRAAEVSIWEDPSGWHFCWSAPSIDGGPIYTCTGEGRTVMTERGEPTFEYGITMTPEPNAGEALVEIVGEPLLDGLTPIRWTDRLALSDDGLTLLSFRIELNGTALDPPQGPARLVKVDDEPF